MDGMIRMNTKDVIQHAKEVCEDVVREYECLKKRVECLEYEKDMLVANIGMLQSMVISNPNFYFQDLIPPLVLIASIGFYC